MSSILRGPTGPLIKSTVKPLSVRKAGCFKVLMRSLRPGPSHGRWEPISTSGFLVVCASKLEACELVWMVGGRHHPRPVSLIQDEHDEERYLDWLLANHFRIEPYTAGQPMEVMFPEFIRGWYPDTDDVLREHRQGPAIIESLLRARWEGK